VWVKKADEPSLFFATGMAAALLLYTPAFVIFIAPGLAPPSLPAAAVTLATGLTEGLYLILLTYAYRAGDLSLIYPVSRGSSPLFIVAGGMLLLGERLSIFGFGAVALVIAGLVSCAWPGGGARVTPRLVVLSLLTGVAVAAHHVGYKWLFRYWPPYAAIYIVWWVTGATLAAYCLLGRPRRPILPYLKTNAPAAAAMGILAMGGFLLALVALKLTLVSYVGAARNVGVVFGVVFGAYALREPGLGRRLAGAAAIAAGVALLAFA